MDSAMIFEFSKTKLDLKRKNEVTLLRMPNSNAHDYFMISFDSIVALFILYSG